MSAGPTEAADLDAVPAATLHKIERRAVELARLAGAEIVAKLGSLLAVRYKGDDDEATWRNPVSDVDHRVEVLIRARLAESFPDHDILGEESEERPGRGHDFVWAVDPVDGTTNFINGFPLFAASIGVIHRGRPIVGAVWCASSHALRAGIYHARRGGPLCFDDQPIAPKPNPAVLRRLAGEPRQSAEEGFPWDIRRTGSAAIECAFAAAGLLAVARFERPNVWDIAGGLALVEAAGREARALTAAGWTALTSFEEPAGPAGEPSDLRHWRRPVILGEREAVEQLCRRQA